MHVIQGQPLDLD